MASRSSTDALVVVLAQVRRRLELGAARLHLVDGEKRVEVRLRLVGRTVELAQERIRATGAALIGVDDITPRAERCDFQRRVADKLGRGLARSARKVDDRVVFAPHAVLLRRWQDDDAEGDRATALGRLVLVDRKTKAAGLDDRNPNARLFDERPGRLGSLGLLAARQRHHGREQGRGERCTGRRPHHGYFL